MKVGIDSLKTKRTLTVGGKDYSYYSLPEAEKTIGDLSTLPYSLKILLENLLRFEDGRTVDVDDVKAIGAWLKERKSSREIAYRPARVLMQDFTGVPAVVDLAAMREAFQGMGGDATDINPLTPVDLVIDHSVMVDKFGSKDAFAYNVKAEYQRNRERYSFLRWGQAAFNNFRVVPPGTGICHQVNLEYLAQGVWTSESSGEAFAYPDTLVGTDSHTTMINGLGVLGWGVGGIEAEAAMLGQPISMLIPKVVGFKSNHNARTMPATGPVLFRFVPSCPVDNLTTYTELMFSCLGLANSVSCQKCSERLRWYLAASTALLAELSMAILSAHNGSSLVRT
jgi:aconitate hydratase